jgi:hypothetical protein
LIAVDWSARELRVEAKAIGVDGMEKVGHAVRLGELR